MFTLAAAALVLTACASSTTEPTAFVPPMAPQPMTEYRVQPGDTLSVKFYYHADHDTDVFVRPDGSIQMPLVGDVPAGGVTPQKLAADLERRYSKNLRDPRIAVTVKTMNQNKVFVGGEVNRPGFVPYRDGLTAAQALLEAGGPKDTANTEEIVFLQRLGDDKYRPAKLNLTKMLADGDVSADLALNPSDVIFVPKTTIAKVNQWVNQYLWNIIPIRASASMLLF
jgi:protein involved in polysaccharide export with SLBB domain